MTLLMRLCALVVTVLCLPLHLIDAVGLYRLYKHVIPSFLYQFSIVYNKKMHDKKKELFRSLADFKPSGRQLTLLEIGCGTGTNFQYYPNGCKVICTDPNPHFQKYLTKGMEDNDHLTYDRFVVASGEDMAAVHDNSVDVVVCTLVLCSVDNVAQTLREIHRILRPVSYTVKTRSLKNKHGGADVLSSTLLHLFNTLLHTFNVFTRQLGETSSPLMGKVLGNSPYWSGPELLRRRASTAN